MKGLELAQQYYETHGRPMLEAQFPQWINQIACGLIGSGSECFGFDDEISRDHDFEIGFCLFIPGEDQMDRQTAFRLERAYAKLPAEFMGLSKSRIHPVGGSRHGVIRIPDFFMEKIGFPQGDPALLDWLRIPENALFELSRGALFSDPSNRMGEILGRLAHFPEDVRLKKLAGELLMMAQAGQYNYPRCLKRGDTAAAQLCLGEFVRAALHGIFLLNDVYMPYYKWQFRALKELPILSELAEPLEYLISSGNDSAQGPEKTALTEDIAGVFVAELLDRDFSRASCGDLEKHAYSVNDHIQDGTLRNLHILAGI